MKISLALGRGGPLSRQMAWGCLTSNAAMPGVGSLLAGRVSGYFQLLLALAGLGLSMVFGLRFIGWYFQNRQWIHSLDTDPIDLLSALWMAVRWALLGLATFGFAWIWGMVTGWFIVREAARTECKPPPKLSR